MTQNRVSGYRTRRFGAALTAVAMVSIGLPSVAHADPLSDSSTTDAGASVEGSVGGLVDQIPEEIVVGGPSFGSEGLRDAGSVEIVDGALSVGQVLGSVAPLEAIGSAGGSAAGSLALSGSVAGSTYVNATGSLGSGTIGLGSLVIPEYVIPMIGVQLAGVVFAAMGERQEVGQLTADELNFWHGIVEGSAEGGTTIETAATNAGVELPGQLTGSIDAVQIAAEEDPHAENERLRVEAEAAAAAEEAAGDQTGEEPVEYGQVSGSIVG